MVEISQMHLYNSIPNGISAFIPKPSEGHSLSLLPAKEFEIMQSTGITDKNGKEIFEGDFVKNNKGKIYKIQFLYGAFYAYAIKIDINKDNGKSLYLMKDIVDVSEIIGNIYENPELLNS